MKAINSEKAPLFGSQRQSFLRAAALKLILAVFVAGSNYWVFDFQGELMIGGDTFSYVDPVENLLAHGRYAADLSSHTTYAGRMPGVALIYLPLRLLLAKHQAMMAFCLIQFAASFIGLWYLGRLTRLLSGSQSLANASMLVYGASTYLLFYDTIVMSESLAATVTIVGVYAFAQALTVPANAKRLLLLSGSLMTWSVFLRPFMLVPLAGLLLLYSWEQLRNRNWGLLLRHGALYIVPFLVIDGAWITRNWPLYQRLVPLQVNSWAGYDTSISYRQLVKLCADLGYEPTFWDINSPMSWFVHPSTSQFNWQPQDLTSSYSIDSLQAFQSEYKRIPFTSKQNVIDLLRDERLAARITKYSAIYQKEYPLRFFLINPIKHVYSLVFKHGVAYLFARPFGELNIFYKTAKLAAVALYYFVVIVGLFGCLFVWRGSLTLLLASRLVIGFVIVFMAFIFKQPEHRYFSIAYPFVVVNFALAMGAILHRISERRLKPIFFC